jgi:hypothetical protein
MDDEKKEEALVASEWFKSRPRQIQEVCLQYPPWKFYRIKNYGPGFGKLYSFDEGTAGKITVKIDLVHQVTVPERVVGVKLEDLEEVDFDEQGPGRPD